VYAIIAIAVIITALIAIISVAIFTPSKFTLGARLAIDTIYI
jgi:hypothetical protein